MKNKKIIVVGAGGFSIVVAETAMLLGYQVVGFVDDKKPVHTKVLNNLEVVANSNGLAAIDDDFDCFIVAIGNNEVRKKIAKKLSEKYESIALVHPQACISPSASIGKGTVVLAGAVINANANIGDNNIINSQVLVDHDTTVGNNCHIAQGTLLGSNVMVKEGVLTNIGQIVPSFSELP